MTYNKLVRKLAGEGELARTHAFLGRFYELVKKTVHKKGRLVLPGFVAFNVRTNKPRKIRNPITGKPMKLPEMKIVKVRASSDWRNVK